MSHPPRNVLRFARNIALRYAIAYAAGSASAIPIIVHYCGTYIRLILSKLFDFMIYDYMFSLTLISINIDCM